MNKIMTRLQEITSNSVSVEDATQQVSTLIPELSNESAIEVATQAREYCIGNINAVDFQSLLNSKGLSDNIFKRFKG